MSLKNLKSVFGPGKFGDVGTIPSMAGTEGGMHEFPNHPSDHSELDIDGNVSPFNPPVHWLNDKPILDATNYAFNSLMDEPTGPLVWEAPLLEDIYNNPETTTSLDDVSSDIRFQAGIGFPSANVILQTGMEGLNTTLYWINSNAGTVLGISGAISKFGEVSDTIDNIQGYGSTFGLNLPSLPPLPFDLNIEDPLGLEAKFLNYDNTVEELFNIDGGNFTDEFANTGDPESTRGIIYQVLGDSNKAGLIPDFSFQDAVQNKTTLNWVNPIESFKPGSITFKDIDLNLDINLDLNLPSLPGIGNPFSGLNLPDLPGLGGIFDSIGENKYIQGLGDAIGGWAKKIGGFGYKLPFPEDWNPMQWVGGKEHQHLFDGVGDFLSGVGNSIGNLIGKASDLIGPLGKASIDFAAKLNPIADLVLPRIKLQSPLDVQKTDYGGEAQYVKNQPRALTGVVMSRRMVGHNEANAIGDITGTAINALSTLGDVKDISETEDRQYKEGTRIGPYSEIGTKHYAYPLPSTYYPNQSMDQKGGGDRITLAGLKKGTDLSIYDQTTTDFINSSDNGMPFYFKDMRDNTYIILRAYIDGLGDNISPSWNESTYVGRSEPVYTYQNTKRNISFNLKLFAQTPLELDAIYSKMHKLTSLCYPQYMPDKFLRVKRAGEEGIEDWITNSKTRMKPPLVRLRIGELYGNSNKPSIDGKLGFLNSISYTFPDETPWEWRKGQRVPMYIQLAIDFNVIHDQVPHKNSVDFYGYYPGMINAGSFMGVNEEGRTGVNTDE